MKIVLTTDKLNRGGKEKQLLILAHGLLTRGHDVNIISKNTIDSDDFYHEIGFPMERIHSLKNSDFNLIKAYKNLLIQLKPAAVLNWSTITALWTLVLKSTTRNISVINCTIRHGIHYSRLKPRLLSKLIVKSSRYNISNSKAGLSIYGLNENENNKVIYNALLKNSDKEDNPISLNKIFGKELNPSDILITNIGGLYKHKNQLSIIKSIKALCNSRYHLLIIGEGDERNILEDFIKENELSKQVVLLGRQTDVLPYLKKSNLYVNASSGEGCSNAIVEAMYCGLPIITTPDGGTKEIAYPISTQYFEFNKVTELAKCINNAPEKKDIDQSKLNQWLRKFDSEIFLNHYEVFIKETVS